MRKADAHHVTELLRLGKNFITASSIGLKFRGPRNLARSPKPRDMINLGPVGCKAVGGDILSKCSFIWKDHPVVKVGDIVG